MYAFAAGAEHAETQKEGIRELFDYQSFQLERTCRGKWKNRGCARTRQTCVRSTAFRRFHTVVSALYPPKGGTANESAYRNGNRGRIAQHRDQHTHKRALMSGVRADGCDGSASFLCSVRVFGRRTGLPKTCVGPVGHVGEVIVSGIGDDKSKPLHANHANVDRLRPAHTVHQTAFE